MVSQSGVRIRQRREVMGLKQAELARRVGVSASYLNLIEHGRRRIAGKLLRSIADALDTELAFLTDSEDPALMTELRNAARENGELGGQVPDDPALLIQHAPDWARLVAQQQERIGALQRMVNLLNDRVTHDPKLASALHEMLSTVTAIRSTASILARQKDISAEWQGRFSRNILEDAQRLAEASRGLVSYLDTGEQQDAGQSRAPEDELADFQAQHHYHMATLETGMAVDNEGMAAVEAICTGVQMSEAGLLMLKEWLGNYLLDARRLPLTRLKEALEGRDPDPFALANVLDLSPDVVMRRLASLPPGSWGFGLVECDASGALLYRKALPEFSLSHASFSAGAPCPRWPLFRALVQPLTALRTSVTLPGAGATLICEAIAMPRGARFVPGQSPQIHGYMLIRRADMAEEGAQEHAEASEPIGITCRICPRSGCAERRVPSLL